MSSFKIPIPKWLNPFYERNLRGDHSYMVDANSNWSTETSNKIISQNHPILTPALLFVSKLFSQADFCVVNTKNGKKVDHWVLDVLKNPNPYQTQNDFLEESMFSQLALGKAVLYVKRDATFQEVDSFYLLDYDLIDFPEGFKTEKRNKAHYKKIGNTTVIYDKDGENLKIKVKDLLFFFDMPNGISGDNYFDNRSRLDGLKQTLINTKDSLLAKNIILKTNGKELITGSGNVNDFPISDDEKAEAENLFQMNYGLGVGRKRGLITQANLNWKSLHIALRDLGLDESVKVDGNLIYTALHIPKDIISLEAKKTTYNNFKESMVSYIQNEMQPTLDAFTAVLQTIVAEKHLKIVGSFEHLPIMQFILIERYDGLIKKGQALSSLRSAGLPDEIALDECGYEKNIILKPLQQNGNQSQGNSQGTQATGNQENEGEEE